MKSQRKILSIESFGLRPNTGTNAVLAVQRCLQAALESDEPCIIDFPKGRYDFYPCVEAKKEYYISNTTTEEENPDLTKTIGFLLKNNRNLMIEGNHSLFIFHGKMTMFVLDQCENIEIRNIRTDFSRPTISEMTVQHMNKSQKYIDVQVHPDSWYIIENKQLYWVGKDYIYQHGPAQEFNPTTKVLKRVPNPISQVLKVEEIRPSFLRLYFDQLPETKLNHVFQMRDGIRDQVGIFIVKSKNISFKNTSVHYMHGLGIVGQFSENLSFDRIHLAPRPETNRTAAAFADFMHMSGTKGTFKVTNSYFRGAHDDAINVHGTHLQIVEKRSSTEVVVRFMHGQSYGFDAFFSGDKIEFLRTDTLRTYEKNCVKKADKIKPREILLTFTEELSEKVEVGDVIENTTWTPQVEITHNHFTQIPTRGILMTTPRKVMIQNNVFDQTYLSGILVACDAKSWFESGRIKQLNIINNQFIDCGLCGDPVIFIHPENTRLNAEWPVHENISIVGNHFQTIHNILLYAKSSQRVDFHENHVMSTSKYEEKVKNPLIYLLACKQVQLKNNHFQNVSNDVGLQRMEVEDVTIVADQPLEITPHS